MPQLADNDVVEHRIASPLIRLYSKMISIFIPVLLNSSVSLVSTACIFHNTIQSLIGCFRNTAILFLNIEGIPRVERSSYSRVSFIYFF